MSRPDPNWSVTDAQGHHHQWYVTSSEGIIPARVYNPEKLYSLPTLIYVTDIPGDDEYPDVGHHECRRCGERIQPGLCADTMRQYIRGFSE